MWTCTVQDRKLTNIIRIEVEANNRGPAVRAIWNPCAAEQVPTFNILLFKLLTSFICSNKMHFLRLMFVLFLGLQLTTTEISTAYQGNSLLCCKITSDVEIRLMSIAFLYQENRCHPYKMDPSVSLQQLLLVISGTVEINPGPGKIKFPCGECSRAVRNSQKSIACDLCNNWYHSECVTMGDQVFDCYAEDENLEWICSQCALKDVSYTLFDTSISSDKSTDSTYNIPKKKSKQLRISICNFQSIWNKCNILKNYLTKNDIDILLGSETHLSENIKNSEMLPPNYTASRKDRNDGYGGVVIIYKNDLQIEEIQHKKGELVSIRVVTYEKPIILTACYRSPSNSNEANCELIEGINQMYLKHKNNPMWFGGDFNLPDIDWSTKNIAGHQYTRKLNDDFLEAFDTASLTQVVDFTTRKKATLDLFLTNRPGLIKNCEPTPGFGDHDTAIIADIFCHPQKIKPIQRKVHVWKRADLEALHKDVKDEMDKFTTAESTETPINNLWTRFKDIILNAQNKNVPTKMTSTRYSQPWFDRDCKRSVRKKNRRYRVFKRTKLDKDWEKYKDAAKTARKTCNNAHNTFIKDKIIENGDKNNKRFFSFVKAKKTDIMGVSPLLDNGAIQTKDCDIAETLNKQFASVFSVDDGTTPEVNDPQGSPIGTITFTRNGILKLLKGLDPSKASGPDGVSTRILKECSDEIADALLLVFTASLKQGKIPDDWRRATITPLYKGGNKNRSKAENYRPVSLTSTTCKIMEHIIYSHIMQHFDKEHILSNTQHGFRKYRSCETQLIQTVHDLAKAINDRVQIDSILLDFSKAFDKVCHRKLLHKLKHYGVGGEILCWITDFLHERTQCVVVRGTSSKHTAVISGVPQGTVLGPLLFLAYINDMPMEIKSKIALFADDSYLYRRILSIEDSRQLQTDLDILVTWEEKWSMEFHPGKCKLLRVTKKRNVINAHYQIHGQQLEAVEKAKYLGVTLRKDLSWNAHIAIICAKASNTRFFLQRNLAKSDSETRLKCYKIFVRPILEYACTVWDPVGNETLASKIEMVQRKCLRWAFNSWRQITSPTALRVSVKMKTLSERRSIARLKMLHECLHLTKQVDKNIIPVRQRCSNIKFKPILGRVKIYSCSFFPSTVQLWNKIPTYVTNIKDIIKFKTEIDKFSSD